MDLSGSRFGPPSYVQTDRRGFLISRFRNSVTTHSSFGQDALCDGVDLIALRSSGATRSNTFAPQRKRHWKTAASGKSVGKLTRKSVPRDAIATTPELPTMLSSRSVPGVGAAAFGHVQLEHFASETAHYCVGKIEGLTFQLRIGKHQHAVSARELKDKCAGGISHGAREWMRTGYRAHEPNVLRIKASHRFLSAPGKRRRIHF